MTSSDRQTSVALVLVYKLPLQSVMFGLGLRLTTQVLDLDLINQVLDLDLVIQVLDLDLALSGLLPCCLVAININGLQQQCLTYLVQI